MTKDETIQALRAALWEACATIQNLSLDVEYWIDVEAKRTMLSNVTKWRKLANPIVDGPEAA